MKKYPGADSLTLFIILDAFRHDYLLRAPYLSSIADWHGDVRETFGFISTRPAMCAGVYPEETDLCFEYQFRPEGKTFSPRLCATLEAASKILPLRPLKLAASAWLRATSRNIIARRTGLIGNIPFDQLRLFDLSEHRLQTEPGYLATPTIYDLLREAGQDFSYFGFARSKSPREILRRIRSLVLGNDLLEADRSLVRNYLGDLERHRPAFAHLHFSACDWVGHRFGPDSDEMEATILALDRMVEEVHGQALGRYDRVRLLLSADHGMVGVTSSHDLRRELARLPVSEPEDYVAFLDSTMARFWFFKPAAERAIRQSLDDLPWGTVLSEEERARHRIRFRDNANGDLFFLLNPGEVLLPNYYQATGAPPHGMHGYDPDERDNQGAVLLHGFPGKAVRDTGALIDLVDLFPTLLDLHGLPKPTESSARSLLQR